MLLYTPLLLLLVTYPWRLRLNSVAACELVTLRPYSKLCVLKICGLTSVAAKNQIGNPSCLPFELCLPKFCRGPTLLRKPLQVVRRNALRNDW